MVKKDYRVPIEAIIIILIGFILCAVTITSGTGINTQLLVIGTLTIVSGSIYLLIYNSSYKPKPDDPKPDDPKPDDPKPDPSSGIPPLENRFLSDLNKNCNYRGVENGENCDCFTGFEGKKCKNVNCSISNSYAKMASKQILGVWDDYVEDYIQQKASRIDYLTLRDQLYIFGFAYGLYSKEISYTKYKLDPETGKVDEKNKKTNDLIDLLLYYTANIYHIIGDAGDMSDSNPNKKKWKKVAKSLQKEFADLLKENESNFKKFLQNPKDNFISTDKRETSGQFWGKNTPLKNLNGYQNISLLVMYQCKNVIEKYEKFNKTYKWVFFGNGIDVEESHKRFNEYHKIRKLIRSLSRTISDFSYIFPALDIKLPETVKSLFGIKDVNPTYGDILDCKHKKDKCTDSIIASYICSAIYAANKEYPVGKFWGLSQIDFDFLRGLVLMSYEPKLGYKSNKYDDFLIIDTACPSAFDTFNKENVYVPYEQPKYNWQNKKFSGRICNLVTYMGDIHNIMVEYVKKPNAEMKDLILKTTIDIHNVFINENFNTIIENVGKSTCGYSTITTIDKFKDFFN